MSEKLGGNPLKRLLRWLHNEEPTDPTTSEAVHPLNRRRQREQPDQAESIDSDFSVSSADQPEEEESLSSQALDRMFDREPGTLSGTARFGESDGGKVAASGGTTVGSDGSLSPQQQARKVAIAKSKASLGSRYEKGKRIGS